MWFVVCASSTLICAVAGLLSWRRRHRRPSAGWLALGMAGQTWWSAVAATAAVPSVNESLGGHVTLAIYPGVGATVAGFACMCWALGDPDWRPTRWTLLLVVEPILISVAALTNPWHELVSSRGPDPSVRAELGPLFLAHAAYSYLILGTGLIHVWRKRRHAAALRTRQLTTVLVSSMVPTTFNVVGLLGLSSRQDISAIGFAIFGLICCYAVFRQDLFEVIPVARAHVLEELRDAVLVLDEQHRLGDVNAAAVALLKRADPPGRAVPGTRAEQALGGLVQVLTVQGGEHSVQLLDGPADVDVQIDPLHDRQGRFLGTVIVVRDVTAATAQRALLAEANSMLKREVATVERLRAEVAEQAVRDPLTGCYNRRHLSHVLAEQFVGGERGPDEVSVLMLDVDLFKSINDQHGHAVGDALLLALADCMRSSVRATDTVARYGGEEFVIVLPGSGAADALRKAERIRARCALVRVPVPGGVVGVTLSAGVSTVGPLIRTPEQLLEAADQALYRAKAEGRDRALGELLPA
ncbi:MAG: diguanylate cyclase with sensor [Frankiales bacterium]|jgi:diguanylate cyclase (GGDEF)-like protein|nr:diguanylate cyclase with sensor [Frankiales bacterium]